MPICSNDPHTADISKSQSAVSRYSAVLWKDRTAEARANAKLSDHHSDKHEQCDPGELLSSDPDSTARPAVMSRFRRLGESLAVRAQRRDRPGQPIELAAPLCEAPICR